MHYQKLILVASLLLALPALPAVAGDADTNRSNASASTKKWSRSADDDYVCTRERVAGSHIPRQICRTRAQIAEEQADSKRMLREMQTNPTLKRPPRQQ